MRASLIPIPALIALGGLASCSRTPYTALPQSPAYHPSGPTTASLTPPVSAPAPAAAAAVPPRTPAETPAALPSYSSPARPTQRAAGRNLAGARARGAAAALRPAARQLLPKRHSETAAGTHASSLGSSLLIVLGILVATVGGAALVVGAAFGASAGLFIVAGLLLVGGIFLAVRGLHRK